MKNPGRVVVLILAALLTAVPALAGNPAITGLQADPAAFNSGAGGTTLTYTLSDLTGTQVKMDVLNAGGTPVRTIDAGTQNSGT